MVASMDLTRHYGSVHCGCPLRPTLGVCEPTDVRGDFGWWNGQMCMSHGEIFMSNDTEAAPQMRSDWQSGALNHWLVSI